MIESISAFWNQYGSLILQGTWDTLVMTVVSTVFCLCAGLAMGILLTITQPHGIWPHKTLNQVLAWIINVGRSLPFIILMIAIMDFTKMLVGTKIGVRGLLCRLWFLLRLLSHEWWRLRLRKSISGSGSRTGDGSICSSNCQEGLSP
jgi:ABC-type methionine transport system permease subunit